MKKVIISTYDDIRNPYYGGGGARAIHEVAKRLKEKYLITIISWNHSGNRHEVIDGVTYKRVGSPHINPKLGNIVFQLLLPLLINKYSCDIWIESFGPPLTTSFLPRFTKKPVMGVVHMLSSEDMKRKYRISLSWFEAFGLKSYETIISTSINLKHKILGITPNSTVTVIGNGIEKVFIPKRKRKKSFLFVGRIEINQKGLDLLIESFAKFKQNDSQNISLDILGYGIPSEVRKLKELIKNSGLKKSIHFRGRIEGKEKERYYHNALALLVTSRFETYSMVSLEALSHGTPVVSFNIQGIRWIPKQASIKVKSFNTTSFSIALSNMANNESLRESAQEVGVQYAKRHTWDVISDKYSRVIDNLITK